VGHKIGPKEYESRRVAAMILQITPAFRIVLQETGKHAYSAHAIALLRAHHCRPRRRAPESRDERAPPHSITSSARASRFGGIVRPSALAVLALMTSRNLVGA
jgi:hypothetical protein